MATLFNGGGGGGGGIIGEKEGEGEQAPILSPSKRPAAFTSLSCNPDHEQEEDDDEGDEEGDEEAGGLYGTFLRTPGLIAETTWGARCYTCFTKVMAVLIAAYITLVDNAPYGLLIFPLTFQMDMLGIQMVVFSAFISQVVYCFASAFPSALGSNIIENVVFLHTISVSVAQDLRRKGKLDRAVSTIIFIFGLSTVLTGLAFYLLGLMKLGKISSFVPRHVLLGCIGGMGMFIATQGIGISTSIPWDFSPVHMLRQFQGPALLKSSVTIALTIGITLLRAAFKKQPVVTPIYFFLVPVLFFVILHYAGISKSEAAEAGWLFAFHPLRSEDSPFPPSSPIDPVCQSFPGVLSCLGLHLVDYNLIVDHLFTMAGIVFFSIIHVPVNVPALSSTTGIEADLNQELMSHGLSNLLSGLTGGLQNYMAYSTSALYYKTGGGGRWSSLAVSSLLLLFLGLGPSAISWFPRPLAGCLLLHLGTVLLWESLVEPWEKSADVFEYATIVTITFAMVVIGFMEGLGIGVLLACCIFVVQGSMVNPIAAAFPGDGLRSREMRTNEERKRLDLRMQGLVYVVRLRGNLFFGNAEQLYLHIRSVILGTSTIANSTRGGGKGGVGVGVLSSGISSLRFVILDLEDVAAIDYHARDRLARTCKIVTSHGVRIVWSQLTDGKMRRALKTAGCFGHYEPNNSQNRMHHFSLDLNSAFSYCENMVLKSLPGPSRPLKKKKKDKATTDQPPPSFFLSSLAKLTAEGDHEVLKRLEGFFTRETVLAGHTLWRRNDIPHMAILLESGLLGVPREKDDPSVRASMAQQPPLSVRTSVAGGGGSVHPWAPPTPHPPLPHLPMVYTGGPLPSPHEASDEHGGGDHPAYLEVSRPGQFSGELGLFTKEVRKYTLMALQDSVLWRVDTNALQAMQANDPQCYIVLLRLALKYASHRLHSLMLVGQVHSV